MDSINYNSQCGKNNSTLLFVIILILLLVIFFNDREITVNQQYLNQIYLNTIKVKKIFKNIINKNDESRKISNEIYFIENFLDKNFFNYLKSQLMNKKFNSKDVQFRKGSGINFNNLHNSNEYKGFLELYYSNDMLVFLSNILKKPISRTPLSDNNSCSLLIYSNPGDYIDWHMDYSNYYGDRYVVLLTMINSNQYGECCSENKFLYKTTNQVENIIKLKPNDLIIFKGSEILHKSTKITQGENRIILSMTFCDICQEKKNIGYGIYEFAKNLILYE